MKSRGSKKDLILEAAAGLFATKGFKETSVAEISKLTGAAEGTIFHHFKTKDDLFLAILGNVKHGIVEEFEQYVQGRIFENGMEMLENIISFYLYLAGKDEDWFSLLQHHYPYDLASVNASCRKHLEDIYNCLTDIFEKAIITGQQDGSIGDVSPRKNALIVFSMVHGLVWFKTHDLYDAGALYMELISACRRMLQPVT